MARLCLAQANGYLSVEAFEERYALVAEATSVATLEALVGDLALDDVAPLPVLSQSQEVDSVMADTDYLPSARAVAAAPSVRIPAVFGSAERAGTWTVPEHIEVMCTLGEVKLDFRDAVFTTDTIVVDASVLFGSLTLILPPGTQIENECDEFMSSSTHPSKGRQGAPPNGILVILQGKVRLGEISIKERPPSGEKPAPRLKAFFTRLLGKPQV